MKRITLRKEAEERGAPGPRGRESALLVASTTIVIALIVLATSAKVYAVSVLPAPPVNWNVTQLARIGRAYQAQKRLFFDTGDPDSSEGYSIAVFGDVHNSVRTFGRLVDHINRKNERTGLRLRSLEADLARARGGERMTPDERDRAVLNLKRKINEALKDRILFAVANGDLTISGNEVQYRMFFEQARRLKVPFVAIPGNHDAKASPSDVYSRIFGRRFYSFTVGKDYFIMLDDSGQVRIEPPQMKWFESELVKSMPYRYCNVFMHVPAFKGHRDTRHKDVNIPWSEYLKDRANARRLKELCSKFEVSYVIGSHLHTFDLDIWDMPGDLATNEAMKRNADDEMVWTIITGGAGAQLWKTYDWRACYHYFTEKVNGQFPLEGSPGEVHTGTQFDKIVIKSANGESWFLAEKVWTYALTDVVNNYPWEMLALAPLLALLFFLLATRGRKTRGAAHAVARGVGAGGTAESARSGGSS